MPCGTSGTTGGRVTTYELDYINKIEVLTADGQYTYLASNLNDFFAKAEDIIFKNVITKYKWRKI